MKSISITRLKLIRWNAWSQSIFFSLEMKSISITRLKLSHFDGDSTDLQSAWNEKHLDYEIETVCVSWFREASIALKWKASRLRDWNWLILTFHLSSIITWNEKHLDYEIETNSKHPDPKDLRYTWNEKHLDYEIETLPEHSETT